MSRLVRGCPARADRRTDARGRFAWFPHQPVHHVVLVLCSVLGSAAVSSAQSSPTPVPSPFAIDVGTERAAVVNNGTDSTWTTQRLQVSWVKPETGGWFAGVERRDRDGQVDVTASARGYKRAGSWTFAVGAAGTPGAHFFFSRSIDGELSRRLVGTLVASAGYRYMSFPAVLVQQAQPALTWYHAHGEVSGRMFFTRRDSGGRVSRALLLQAVYDVTPRFRVQAGGSRGDRIFDVGLLAGDADAPIARVAFATVRAGFTRHDAIEVGGTLAREGPAFDYRAISVGYRRTF